MFVSTAKLTQLMEQLDVFISIKPKPKQPSKVNTRHHRHSAVTRQSMHSAVVCSQSSYMYVYEYTLATLVH